MIYLFIFIIKSVINLWGKPCQDVNYIPNEKIKVHSIYKKIINKEKVMMIIKKITYDNDHEHHLATQQAAQ